MRAAGIGPIYLGGINTYFLVQYQEPGSCLPTYSTVPVLPCSQLITPRSLPFPWQALPVPIVFSSPPSLPPGMHLRRGVSPSPPPTGHPSAAPGVILPCFFPPFPPSRDSAACICAEGDPPLPLNPLPQLPLPHCSSAACSDPPPSPPLPSPLPYRSLHLRRCHPLAELQEYCRHLGHAHLLHQVCGETAPSCPSSFPPPPPYPDPREPPTHN